MLWKMSVGWVWWSDCPHGRYHHCMDHRIHDLVQSTCSGKYKLILNKVIIQLNNECRRQRRWRHGGRGCSGNYKLIFDKAII